MQHIWEDCKVRVTALKFGQLSSDLLAYGSQDGMVRIAELGKACIVRHVSQLKVFMMDKLQSTAVWLKHYIL